MNVLAGEYLPKKLAEAKRMHDKQKEYFNEFSAHLREAETPFPIDDWESMVSAWELDPKQPDPYQEPPIGVYCFYLYCYSFYLLSMLPQKQCFMMFDCSLQRRTIAKLVGE